MRPKSDPPTGLPRVLAILPALIPSTLISVVKPLVALHARRRVTARVSLEPFTSAEELRWAEVIVFCRNQETGYAARLETIVRSGTPYIYDLDDNLFALPPSSNEGRYHQAPHRIAFLERYLAKAGLVRVYSDPMVERIGTLSSRVRKVNGSLDWSLVSDVSPARDPSCTSVVYVTSRIDDDLAELFLADVTRLLDHYASRLRVVFWGGGRPRTTRRRGLTLMGAEPDYDRFLRRLAGSGFDIGLAPLKDDEFHRSKSNNKFREYGACRIAGVFSDVSVYSSCVSHEHSGMLVPLRPGAWYEAVERLIKDPALRARIQDNAWHYVRMHHSQDRTESEWLEQIAEVLQQSRGGPRDGGRFDAGPEDESAPPGLGMRAARSLARLRRVDLRRAAAGARWYVQGLWMLARIRRQLARRR